MEKLSLFAARLTGLKYYFTGKPCKNGHVAKRHVHNQTCSVCVAQAIDNWVKTNKGRHAEYSRKRRLRMSPEEKAAVSEYNRKWRKENFIHRKIYDKKYAQDNPDARRASSAKRRALHNAAEGYFTKDQIIKMFSDQNCQCANCCKDISIEYEIDHIMPLSKGGTNYIDNIQLLCPNCNARKHNMTPSEWLQREGKIA